jgi:hypothetical protein
MAHQDMRALEARLLERLRTNPDHQRQLGSGLLDALIDVAKTSDYNTAYPSAPLGRDEALRSLRRLQHALEEAFNVVPGVDVPDPHDAHAHRVLGSGFGVECVQ